MTNVEDRVNKFRNGVCPDCGTKLEKTKYEDGQEPIIYCTRCLVSFELCGGQVMSEGNLKQRVNEKWRSFREATSDGMHEISVGIEEDWCEESEKVYIKMFWFDIKYNRKLFRPSFMWDFWYMWQ